MPERSEPDPMTVPRADRVLPTRSSSVAAAASRPFGGPIGAHAVVGRHWFWSPLRVCLLLAVLTLTVGWFGKAACIQQFDTGDGTLALDWRGERPYVAMCYSDVVPLYGAERLDNKDFFPYRDGWLELSTPDDVRTSVTLLADDDGYRVRGNAEALDAGGQPYALSDGDRIGLSDRALRLADGRTVELGGSDEARFMEYPVLTGLFQWASAKLTDAWLAAASAGILPGALAVAVYFNIVAFFLAFAWLCTVWAVLRSSPRRPWDAALVALSPLAIVHAFTNFDTLATALAATALLAWARRKPVLAGVLIGVGAAIKLYPLFLLGPLLVLCLRAGKLSTWARTVGAAGLSWAMLNLPIMLTYPRGWREFLRLNTERDMDPDSLYNVVRHFSGWQGFDGPVGVGEAPTILNAVSGGLFLLCCVAIAWIALSAPVRPRLAQLCFLVVAVFLMTNKVWSPQFSLWLVPLAVLAIGHWRLLLGWMTIDALVWVPRMMYYLGVGNMGLPESWFLGTVVLRDLAVAGLCALIIYQIYHPTTDPMRQGGVDDEGGGVLDRARDVVVLPAPRLRRRAPSVPRTHRRATVARAATPKPAKTPRL